MPKSSESSGISKIYNNIHFWRENHLEKKQTQQKMRNPTGSYWNTGFREGWWGGSEQSLTVLAPHSRWLRCGTEPLEGGVGGGHGRGLNAEPRSFPEGGGRPEAGVMLATRKA